MEQLKQHIRNFDWSLKSIIKASVAIVIVVIALAIVLGVLRTVAKSVFGYDVRYAGGGDGFALMDSFVGNFAYDEYSEELAHTKAMSAGRGGMVADFAVAEYGIADSRIAPIPPIHEGGGADAEEYERRDYSAHYETRAFEKTCNTIADLKPLEYVVFDNSNKSERWCHYNFRVELEHEDEVLTILKDLDPETFDINTSTIERSVEYTDSELAMQQRRLTSLQETLTQAEDAFDSLLARARAQGDTKTLSDVINNKINTIERLNQQILNAQDRVDRLTRQQDGNTEQITFAHFNASVQKVVLIDSEALGEMWKDRIRQLASDINETLLALTIGLVGFVLKVVQFIVFAGIALVALVAFTKVFWTVGKRIWHWRRATGTVVQNHNTGQQQ